MATDREPDARSARERTSLSAVVAVVAGGNVAGVAALAGIYWLRKRGLLGGPPWWAYMGLIAGATAVDVAGRLWHARKPGSRVREQARVVIAAGTTTVILYVTGWGSILTVGYVLCAVQQLAQQRNVDWRAVYAWCVAGILGGELAVAAGIAPTKVEIGGAHAMAVAGAVLMAAVLWIVDGILKARDSVEKEVRERERRLAHEAATDSLTQLFNRGAFADALEQACGRHEPIILAFVDLDGFKDINDTFGHHVGDEVLVEVAARLRSVVREGDVIARYGGDEFVILVTSAPDETAASRLVERIWSTLAEPWPAIAPNTISASCGVVHDPEGTRSPDDLLREADQAMYARKHGLATGGSVTTMTSRALAHHRLAMDGMRGSFTVLQAIRDEHDRIVDYEMLEANSIVRSAFEPIFGEVVGARLSALNAVADNTAVVPLYEEALTTGECVHAEVRTTSTKGGRTWNEMNIVRVDRDVVAIVTNDVTAEVETREALERERIRFASLVADSADLSCVVDDTGRVVYAPPWGTTFLGFDRHEMGQPLVHVAPGDRDDAAAWFEEVRLLAAGAQARSIVLRLVGHDGVVHTCEVTATNRRDEPAIGGIVLNARDVSALVEAEARLGAIANAVVDVIAICDADGNIMWVSDAARDALGIEPADLVGRHALSVVHPDDHEAVANRLIEFVGLDTETSDGPNLELRLRHADGSYRWYEASATNQLGDPSIRGLVISLRDISDRRSSENDLRLSEERNRSILEAAADAIISVDGAGTIQSFNRAAETIFATNAADAVGRHYTCFLPDDALPQLRSLVAQGRRDRIDTIATRATGERFAAQVAISVVRVGDREYYTAVLRDVSDQRAMEQALRVAASCDELTGLPNRRSILDRAQVAIERARGGGDLVGMVIVDLDRFKLVNDGLGHEAGDRLLVQVAERIAGVIRAEDVVARLGSDEFVVLCPNAADLDAIKAVALRIVDALDVPFRIGEEQVFIGASIGVSVSAGEETSLELLRSADTAMYRAKERATGEIEVFDAEMQRRAARRLDVESALRQATAREELLSCYQPIVDLEDGRVVHFEALVRWRRPGVGLVRPDEFIPVAEDAGIIVDIGTWMLRRATADCARWQEVAPGVGVSVNVSVRQFEATHLVETVQAALAESGLRPDLLTLEITESVMLEHTDRNVAIMQHIRDLGVHLALDDFGSGYSSLTYLRRLPIDSIKIDRSFLESLGSGLRDSTTLHAIVALSDAHELDAVAEGIDTDAKLDAVRSLGCRFGQGYLFAKPMPYPETIAYLAPELEESPTA